MIKLTISHLLAYIQIVTIVTICI